ncbi:chemotaxis protein CheW [Treponema saccharophilum]|jgi:chemotaxis signal transduction protein|uniref:CheW protein n=1 Tax=Treponema saccharophilum DSM 2985 TaxID=907348 RepID=H7EIC1_9SPIR|nr:chemotaxis protein CheW [Treponema saccharophilum]EIC02691.1 CheW protein [Treponema saccharophilum DSM 2985]BDC95073.1 chemotaxis protein CheW [Treponema saccharophilum]
MDNRNADYFSFMLGKGMFAVPVMYVKEVFEFTSLTPVPNSLGYLRGVMNIRGSVVSIIDLRKLFGFNPSDELSETSVIDLEIPRNNEKPIEIAIIADSVDVVSGLSFIQAGSASYGIPEGQSQFVRAVARRGDEFILVLDLDKILRFIESDVDKAEKAGI